PKDVIPNSVESQRGDHSDDVPSETLEPRKESRDAIFDENCFFLIPRPKDVIPNSVESQRDDHSNDVPRETLEPRKEEDLRTYNEAMQSWDAAFWKEAIDDEIFSIIENNTWVLSDLPPECKSLGCKWVFKRNMKVDRIIDTFKA
nr:hypothetical protein [Tanacetum cinerariifolium]